MERINVEPKASEVLGSLRSIGYGLETALADIVDNSIAAAHENDLCSVEIVSAAINTHDDALKWIAIVDNGTGMNEDGIKHAFTLGGKGVAAVRGEKDLGRFGLGLKTASLSQCKKFSVLSRSKGNAPVSLVFDLHYMDDHGWFVYSRDDVESVLKQVSERMYDKEFFNSDSWTLILWEEIDKIDIHGKDDFYRKLSRVHDHFALVYHKFINVLSIRINTTKVEFWDPFAGAVSSQKVNYAFDSSGITFEMRRHILKHKSEFSDLKLYEDQSKYGTFNQNQGFFVYRLGRLIYRGSWLGLFSKEPQYNLSRIEINLNNSVESDKAWDVNISKSSVRIPRFVEGLILGEANLARSEANDTFRFHGGIKKHKNLVGKSITGNIEALWKFENTGTSEGMRGAYRLNRDHFVLKSFQDAIKDNPSLRVSFTNLLKNIELSLPVEAIFTRESNNELDQMFYDEAELKEEFFDQVNDLAYRKSLSRSDVFNILVNNEPYNRLSFTEEEYTNYN